MNILELDSYNLADTVKFHDRLNPRLWNDREHLRPEVKAKLMQVAQDFQEFLGVPDLDVKDITISGSNAAFNYTPGSDIDLHLVIDVPNVAHDEVYRELFNAKKYQYNDEHDIRIRGADVELYAQDSAQPHHSQGIYSILNDSWVSVPKRTRAEIDDVSTRSKFEDLAARIDEVIKSQDLGRMDSLMKKIKTMRQTGLEQQGEFGSDNLAFKLLRNNGYIKRLIDAKQAARDQELSLAELARPQQKIRYGFGESPDGVDPTTKMFLEEPMDESPDGVNPTTAMFLTEVDTESVVQEFIQHTADRLGIQRIPEIVIHHDEDWSESNHSFGMYVPERHELHVSLSNRHLLDVLRTTAHELCHCAQHESEPLPDNAGDTGSDWENEANAVAGIVMRDFAGSHPEYFQQDSIKESASGYIPTKAQAKDPRYSMALTVDIKPGQVGREANKLALNTGRNGEPGLLMKSANLREGKIKLSTDPKNYGATIGNYKATGPVVDMRPGQLVGFEPDDKMNQPASKANVKKIIAGLKRGDELPPLLVRKYKKGYQILDGHHRFHAYKLTGAKSIPVQIVPAKDIEELKESRMPQPSQGQGRYRELNEPLGPESPPTMPAGTVRVDVSDVYDWYKLGQHISNMKGLGKHDFGAGPPASIISFGDEETEHKFIKDLEATGLDVTDIDPKDPKQPQGMRRIKTDPTYNVAENELAESLRQELELFEDDLFEIRMSPSSLRQEAAKTGALAGMEFEMIVPNVEDNDGDMEPDYDYDQRCRSIQDAYDFFYDGDYNGRREAQNLRDKMYEDYHEWLDEKISEEWNNDSEEYILEWVKNNVDESVWNPDDLENSPRDEALEEYAVNVHADPGSRDYQSAYEEFREERQDNWDESDWLDDQDLDLMSNVENAYSISWPHWTTTGGGESEISDVAQDFENAIGRDTWASDSYHSGGTLRPSVANQRYIVEPDGSLDGDNPGDRGLEFVSPPLPIDEILSDLKKVKAWAGEYGCYTNGSTGLHINISVPNYSRENLDFVKLALLMGDRYVLDAFGRTGNTYAKSALGIIKDAVRQKPEDAAKLLDKMKGNLDQLATKAIHSGITQKYTSINTKDGHIEFRSPGGDWLDENFDKIENTLLRFTVAMSAALNPEMYREEYLKKLYKLLSENNRDDDTIKYFSDYVAGKIPKAALRSFVKQAQLERRIKRDPTGGKKYWWRVYKEGKNAGRYGAQIELVATSEQEAKDKAAEEWRTTSTRGFDAEPVRPYEEKPGSGNWGVWIGASERFARSPGTGDAGPASIRRFPSREAGEQFLDATRAENPRMRTDVEIREIPADYQMPGSGSGANIGTQTDMENRLGWGSQSDDANYEVVNRQTLQPVFRFIANTPDEANRKYGEWLAAAGLPQTTQDYAYRDLEAPGSGPRASAATDNVFGIGGQRSSRTDGRNIDYSFGDLFGTNPTASINYELYNRLTDQVIDTFPARNDQEAQTRLRDYRQFGAGQSSPDHFGVRRGPGVDNTVQTTDQQQGGIIDVEPNVAQNFGSSTFSGTWRVVNPDGEELYRFSGVGNAQADANRVAMDWLRRNPQHMQTGVEVVPVMSEGLAEGRDLQEIENIPAYMFAGGKDMLDTHELPAKKKLRPLPGGTDLLYAIDEDRHGQRVAIVDPGVSGITRPQVVAVLHLDPVHYLPNTVQVGSITVDEDYRGRGLAKSLYGIVLTIMRKNLLSGDSQTPGGRQNWLSLAAIPGVEVRGLVRIPNQVFDMNKTAIPSPGYQKYADRVIDQVMDLGGQFFSKNNNSTYWLFDVVPGKGGLRPAVKNSLSKLYGYDADNLLLARWSGA